MPRAPKKCGRDGCEVRVTGRTYCEEHTSTWAKGDTRRNDAGHKAFRRAVLKRCDEKCQIKGPRCAGVAVEADHIQNVAEGGARYDPANGQGACIPCHKAKTAQEAARGRTR